MATPRGPTAARFTSHAVTYLLHTDVKRHLIGRILYNCFTSMSASRPTVTVATAMWTADDVLTWPPSGELIHMKNNIVQHLLADGQVVGPLTVPRCVQQGVQIDTCQSYTHTYRLFACWLAKQYYMLWCFVQKKPKPQLFNLCNICVRCNISLDITFLFLHCILLHLYSLWQGWVISIVVI